MPSSIDTRVIHEGEPEPRVDGAVVAPIFQTAMYEYGEAQSGEEVRYIRYGNSPDQIGLQDKLADLEGGEACLVAASGMAAISCAVLGVVEAGERILAAGGLYGGTHALFTRGLPSLGIGVDFVEAERPDSWEEALRPETRAIYVESIANPLMEVGDLEAVAGFARERDLVSLIDNTFATPVNFRPPEHGFDLSLHSGTKYLNGHSDLVAGAAIGPDRLVEAARGKLKHFGGALDPHACFLLRRGVKTLALRVARHNESAGAIARFLEGHEAVSVVNYPGLESHPAHERARRLFDGFGGMLSFELAGGLEAARSFMGALTIPVVAPSLGGVESLVTRPAATSHASLSPEEREAIGISEGLVRMSVGVEGTEDLIEDLGRALEAAG